MTKKWFINGVLVNDVFIKIMQRFLKIQAIEKNNKN